MISKTYSRILRPKILKIHAKNLDLLQQKVQKLSSDESNSDINPSDEPSDTSDPSVVTLYSVVKLSDLYSVVVRLLSAYSDYSVYNHVDSLYSVVVKSLCELCVEFSYSVVVVGAGGTVLCYNIAHHHHHLRVV